MISFFGQKGKVLKNRHYGRHPDDHELATTIALKEKSELDLKT